MSSQGDWIDEAVAPDDRGSIAQTQRKQQCFRFQQSQKKYLKSFPLRDPPLQKQDYSYKKRNASLT
jgi:hypothetical protein